LQNEVQKIVADEIAQSGWLNISNGAAVVLDSKNGEILAYAGSADYFNEEIDGNVDIITSYRQPGSSVKPVTYSLAFQNGMTPASTINDRKTTFRFEGQPPYTPVNYDGKFHGKVTLRQALANSYNIPALKLANRLGPDNIVKLGNSLGLKNWVVDNSYGISVTLGGKEVRLLDLTNVFATFSRGGIYKETKPLISVKDSRGFEIYTHDNEGERVLSEEITFLITDILKDNIVRAPTFGFNSPLNIEGYDVAVKTGTTDKKRDNWTVGYTPSFVTGVWVGNNDNTPMNPYLSSGISGAAPIWNQIMTYLLKDSIPEQFSQPENVVVKFDPDCNNKSEVFIRGTAPAHLCDPSEENN
jgi:membrane peptidoglycan carboxypeptidase